MVRSAWIYYNASVWDIHSLEWIEPYLDFFKVGSGDLTAYPILKWMADKSKPIILSTGLSSLDEIEATIAYIRSVNAYYNKPDTIILLQCTTNYPTKDEDVNLAVIPLLKERFNIPIGYSHHNLHSEPLWIAAALGAEVLEFHFTDVKEGRSFRDHQLSLTYSNVLDLKSKISLYKKFIGTKNKFLLNAELLNNHHVSFRRAIYPSLNLNEGDVVNEQNLCTLRPNIGIDAREWDKLLGRVINRSIKKHEPLNWSYFD
jgi:N-acetylneuraminate synthase/N,N'-diacetyllegionaminate synthase